MANKVYMENYKSGLPIKLAGGFYTKKSIVVSGSANIDFSGSTGTFKFPTGAITGGAIASTGSLTAGSATGTTAGGSTTGLKVGSAGIGVFVGSGAPTISAAQGSLYLRSDGSSTSTRAYINSDGGTTWVAVTTAS